MIKRLACFGFFLLVVVNSASAEDEKTIGAWKLHSSSGFKPYLSAAVRSPTWNIDSFGLRATVGIYCGQFLKIDDAKKSEQEPQWIVSPQWPSSMPVDSDIDVHFVWFDDGERIPIYSLDGPSGMLKLLKMMKSGSNMTLQYRDKNGRSHDFSFSLTGVAAGIEAIEASIDELSLPSCPPI